MDKSPIKIYGNDALSSRVAAFQKKADDHQTKQKLNPFSESGHVSSMAHQKWDKSDPRYGKPEEGSKTAERGKAAGSHVVNEINFLCEMISQYGTPNEDGTAFITFGELFQVSWCMLFLWLLSWSCKKVLLTLIVEVSVFKYNKTSGLLFLQNFKISVSFYLKFHYLLKSNL